jgi:hypothetical protein
MAFAIPAASMMEAGLGSNAMRHSWRHHGRLKPLERFPGLEPVLGCDLAPRRAQDEGRGSSATAASLVQQKDRECSSIADAIGASAQMFGAQQQVPHRGPVLLTSNRQRGAIGRLRVWRDPVAGSVLPVFHRPLLAPVALKLNMSWHNPDLYLFLSLLAGFATLLAIIRAPMQERN